MKNLRAILADEGLVKRAAISAAKQLRNEADLSKMQSKYPKLTAYLKKWELNSIRDNGIPDGYMMSRAYVVKNSANLVRELERVVVYQIMSENGPDLDPSRLGRMLTKIRRQAGDILQAFEDGTLYSILDGLGLFGRSSDKLRADADKFW